MKRFAASAVALAVAALLSACVFAPPLSSQTDTNAISKLGEQAVATCGVGNVREVNSKSFSCK